MAEEESLRWLTEKANQLKSDKGTTFFDEHYYTRHYAKLFTPIRHSLRRILEIGLNIPQSRQNICPSLRMWVEFFPNALVHGADINTEVSIKNSRISIHYLNQSDPVSVQNLSKFFTQGDLDVIIDDCSHYSWDQQLTLSKFFPFLAPGGLYIIEDLQCEFHRADHPVAYHTREFCHRLADGEDVTIPKQEDISEQELQYLRENIDRVEFYDSQKHGPEAFVVLYKK